MQPYLCDRQNRRQKIARLIPEYFGTCACFPADQLPAANPGNSFSWRLFCERKESSASSTGLESLWWAEGLRIVKSWRRLEAVQSCTKTVFSKQSWDGDDRPLCSRLPKDIGYCVLCTMYTDHTLASPSNDLGCPFLTAVLSWGFCGQGIDLSSALRLA